MGVDLFEFEWDVFSLFSTVFLLLLILEEGEEAKEVLRLLMWATALLLLFRDDIDCSVETFLMKLLLFINNYIYRVF